MDEAYERIILKRKNFCIFNMPTTSTSKGFYLDDWKEMIWEGKLIAIIFRKCCSSRKSK